MFARPDGVTYSDEKFTMVNVMTIKRFLTAVHEYSNTLHGWEEHQEKLSYPIMALFAT